MEAKIKIGDLVANKQNAKLIGFDSLPLHVIDIDEDKAIIRTSKKNGTPDLRAKPCRMYLNDLCHWTNPALKPTNRKDMKQFRKGASLSYGRRLGSSG